MRLFWFQSATFKSIESSWLVSEQRARSDPDGTSRYRPAPTYHFIGYLIALMRRKVKHFSTFDRSNRQRLCRQTQRIRVNKLQKILRCFHHMDANVCGSKICKHYDSKRHLQMHQDQFLFSHSTERNNELLCCCCSPLAALMVDADRLCSGPSVMLKSQSIN